MSFVPISKNAPSRVGLNQYARNGLSPVADFQNIIAERVGYAVSVRAKQVYRSPGQIYSAGASVIPASSASERTRWRFAAHAAPYAQYMFARFWQARQSSGAAADCYARLRITDSSGAFLAEASPHFGSGTSAIDTPAYFGSSMWGLVGADGNLVAIPPNAAYFGTFTDFNYGRLVAACVWEVAFVPNTDEGYPSVSAGSGSPIYDKDRSDAAEMANAEWAYKAQPLWHWSVDTDAGVRSQALGDLSGSLTQSIGSFTLAATGTSSTTPPTYQDSSGLASATSADVTVSWPTHLANDVALLSAVTGSSTVPALSGPGSGDWTWVTGGGNGLHMWRARASGASMDDVTVENVPGIGNTIAAAITTYRGCITSGSPIDVVNAISETSDTVANVVSVSTTTTVANTLLVGIVGMQSPVSFSNWAHTFASPAATSVTERFDESVAGIPDVSNGAAIGVVTGILAAAGGAAYFTADLSSASSYGAILLALKP